MKNQKTAIDDYIKQRPNHHFTKEDLKYCLENFTKSRKNFTFAGKLKIHKVDFSNEDLRGVDLSKFDVTDASFINTKMDKLGLIYLLGYAKKSLIKMNGVDIRGLDLSGLDLSKIDWTGVDFQNVKLDRDAIISLADALTHKKISLKGADLSKADLTGKYVVDYEIGYNGFYYLDLRNMIFDEVNLREADLSGAVLNGSSFRKANLESAKIIATFARNTDFEGAVLKEASLESSDFANANFDEIDLTRATV